VSYLDGLIIDIDEGERSRVRQLSGGRVAYEPKITFTREGFEWLRTGILCIQCFGDLRPQGAFPEKCGTCGFPVAELQLIQLGHDDVGEEVIGSRVSLSDELSRMGELWVPPES
jgi:hypothetical protein